MQTISVNTFIHFITAIKLVRKSILFKQAWKHCSTAALPAAALKKLA
jgi:hypothetical protein